MSWSVESTGAHQDYLTKIVSKMLNDEREHRIDVLLSRLLMDLDAILTEGKKLVHECLDLNDIDRKGGETVHIPESLLQIFELKSQNFYFLKEDLSLEKFRSLFPNLNISESILKEEDGVKPADKDFMSEEEGLDDEDDEEEDEDEEDEEGAYKSVKEEMDEIYDEDDESISSGRSSCYKKRGNRVCHLCNKMFSKDFKNFAIHVSQCELIASYGEVRDGRTCPKCHKKYKRSYLIGRHLELCQGDIMENGQLWSRDGEDGNLFKCERCLKTYKSRHHFASHLATCERRKKSSCAKCNKYFPTQEELDRHPCPKYAGDKKFTCQLCDYSCYYGPQLTKHYTSKHGGKRDYCCETCGKMYADPSVLATHRRTHSEPSHKCQECGKAFHRRATLTRHMTMHFSLNLPCETCGKCFSNQLYLNRHRNSQHPPDGIIVTHPCPHCSSSYREKKFLKKHIRDKHSFDATSSIGPPAVVQQQTQQVNHHPLIKEPERQTPEDCKTILGLPFMHTIHS